MYAESLGLSKPDYFNYLSLSGAYKVDGTDDNKEYQETMVRAHCRQTLTDCVSISTFVTAVS